MDVDSPLPVVVQPVRCPLPDGAPPQEIVGSDRYEIYLVRRGCFAYRTAGADVLVDPTTCLLGGPGQQAEVAHPHGGGDTGTAVYLSADVVAAVGRDSVDLPAVARATPQMQRMHRVLVVVAAESGERAAIEELAVRLLAAALGQAEPHRVGEGRRDGARRRLFDDARAAMIADPSLVSVLDVARVVGCSPHHLSRVFSAHTGAGVGAFRRALRLHEAVEQILDGGRTLADVAAACGFADHAHLTRAVREAHGVPPSQLSRLIAGDVNAAPDRARRRRT